MIEAADMSTDGGPVDFACATGMDSGLFSVADFKMNDWVELAW